MNRREFLQAGLAAVVLPAGLANVNQVTLEQLRRIALKLQANRSYVSVLHPGQFAGFVRFSPRGRWQDAYRWWRMDGKPLMLAQRIFEEYSWKPSKFMGEIGCVESVRWVVT